MVIFFVCVGVFLEMFKTCKRGSFVGGTRNNKGVYNVCSGVELLVSLWS